MVYKLNVVMINRFPSTTQIMIDIRLETKRYGRETTVKSDMVE